jgi:hypothetical protein
LKYDFNKQNRTDISGDGRLKPDNILLIASAFMFWTATTLVAELTFQHVGVLFRAQIFLEIQYLCVSGAAVLLYAAGIALAKRAFSKRQY